MIFFYNCLKNHIYVCMDIIKYLKKLNITIVKQTMHTLIFNIDGIEKEINIKDLEQYLFICLVDYIKESEK